MYNIMQRKEIYDGSRGYCLIKKFYTIDYVIGARKLGRGDGMYMQYNQKRRKQYTIIFCLLGILIGMLWSEKVQATEVSSVYIDQPFVFTLDENDNAVIRRWEGTLKGDVVIPGTLSDGTKEHKVVAIGYRAFYTNAMTSVTIPNSVESIGEQAFMNTALTTVTFEEGSCLKTIGEEAFELTDISSVIIPKSVETLGRKAFSSDLTSIIFEKGSQLKSIGASVFSGSGITAIELPDGLQTIGNNAFNGSALVNVHIPASVTTIGDDAFSSCESLDSVTFARESQLESIGAGAFLQSTITDIVIPSSVKTIGDSAFKNCKSLVTVGFEEGSKLQSIGNELFYYNSALQSVTIPANVTSIGEEAFFSCGVLTELNIPEDSQLETIGASAFNGLFNNTEIFIPSSVTAIGESAFNCNSKLTQIILPPNLETLGDSAFSSCSKLKTVYYPDSVGDRVETVLGQYYSGLKGEYSISDTTPPTVTITYTGTLPDNIEIPIDFGGVKIEQVVIGDLPTLPLFMNAGCSIKTLSELSSSLPKGYVFEEPSTAVKAGDAKECNVIYQTSGGESYTFTVAVTAAEHKESDILYTGEGEKTPTCTEDGAAHTECTVCQDIIKESFVIKATGHQHTEVLNVKDVTCKEEGYTGDTWCKDCEQTIEVGSVIPKLSHTWDNGILTKEITDTQKGEITYTCTVCKEQKVEAIEQLLEGMTVTDSETKEVYTITQAVEEGAKTGGTIEYVKPGNKSIKKIVIPKTILINGVKYKVTSIADKAFKNCKKLTAVSIGNNVKTIGKEAFSGCKKLKTVKLGSNVTTIGAKAFYNCVKLTSITIPSKVSKIGKSAFEKCKKLKTVTIKTKKLTAKKVGAKAFKGIKSNATIKVPKKKYKTYKSMLYKKGVSKKARFKKI